MPVSPYEAGDLEQLRNVLTGEMLPNARRLSRFELRAPASTLGLEVLDEASITHFGGYDSGGAGWGSRTFERRHVEIESVRYSPGRPGEVVFTYRDLRGSLMRTSFETGIIREASDQLMLGNARALASPRCWFRATKAWMDDPAGNGLVQEVTEHVPKCSANGFLIERAAEQLVLNAIFFDLSNWTSTVAGDGSITSDASISMFTSPGLGNIKNATIKNSSATGTPTKVSQQITAGNLPANGDVATLQIDHWDPDGSAPWYYILDNTNGKWFRASDQTWQPNPQQWNQVPLSQNAIGQYSIAVPFTAAIANLEVGFGWRANTDGASATTRLFYYGVTWGRAKQVRRWPSSRFSASSGLKMRSPDLYIWGNSSSQRCFNASQGTALFKLRTLWNSADVTGAANLVFELLRVAYDANNLITIFYDGATSKFFFRRRQGGANTDCSSGVVSITAGSLVKAAFRWTSDQGELVDTYGAPTGSNRWFDMIINGTRVAGSQSVQPVETTDSNVYVGGTEGQQFDGYMQVEIVPYVLTETECARWLA